MEELQKWSLSVGALVYLFLNVMFWPLVIIVPGYFLYKLLVNPEGTMEFVRKWTFRGQKTAQKVVAETREASSEFRDIKPTDPSSPMDYNNALAALKAENEELKKNQVPEAVAQ
jgi:hypothetical protein